MGWLSELFGNSRPPRPKPVDPPKPNPTDMYIQPLTGGIVCIRDEGERMFPAPSIPEQGAFVFPGYGTEACKITHSGHNIRSVGYSYWNNINAHKGQKYLKVLLSHDDVLTVFTIDKNSMQVMDINITGIRSTGEGCYWDKQNPNIFYFIEDQSTFCSFNVTNGEIITIIATYPNYLWQPNSSWDGKAHSMTLRDSNYTPIKWLVVGRGFGDMREIEIEGSPDECQIDKSGNWLLIKEGADARIINLVTNEERVLKNEEGAPGHSDMGFGLIIGEDDYAPEPGSLYCWYLGTPDRALLWHRRDWNLGHVSFCNALDQPLEKQSALVSGGNGHELFLVKLDGSMRALAVCPDLTESRDYNYLPKANLCPHGQFACWSALIEGRVQAFVVKLPIF